MAPLALLKSILHRMCQFGHLGLPLQDYHVHTNRSDGLSEPTHLLAAAEKTGRSIISITDHNTLTTVGTIPAPMVLIPGTELSTCYQNRLRVHVLAYFWTHDTPQTLDVIGRIRIGHIQRELARRRRLSKALNLKLTEEALLKAIGSRVPNWRLVADALVSSGDATSPEQASEVYLKLGRPGHVSYEMDWPKLPTEDAVQAVSADGGLAFVAHPGNIEADIGTPSTIHFFETMVAAGLAGFEVTSSRQHLGLSPQTIDCLTRDLRLTPVFGSDCHDVLDWDSSPPSKDIRFLCHFIAHSVRHLPHSVLDMPLEATVIPSESPDCDYFDCGRHLLADLSAVGVRTTRQLCQYLTSCLSEPWLDTLFPQSAVFLNTAVSKALVETSALNTLAVRPEDANRYASDSHSNRWADFVTGVHADILTGVLSRRAVGFMIESYLCAYTKVERDRAEAFAGLAPESYVAFRAAYDATVAALSETTCPEAVLDDFVSLVCADLGASGRRVIGVHRRGLKSPISAYEKTARFWLCAHRPTDVRVHHFDFAKPPARPTIEDMLAVFVHTETVFPDLYAATILLDDDSITAQQYSDLACLNMQRHAEFVVDVTSVRRRWYHHRYYIAGVKNGVPVEITIKTISDYWFSRFFYFATKFNCLFCATFPPVEQDYDHSFLSLLKNARNEEDLQLLAWYHLVLTSSNRLPPGSEARECLKTASTTILDIATSRLTRPRTQSM